MKRNNRRKEQDFRVFTEEAQLIDQLYNKCLEYTEKNSQNISDLVEEICLTRDLVYDIQKLQKNVTDSVFSSEKRSVRIEKFINWCKNKRFYNENELSFHVTNEEREEYGLITLKELKEDDLIVKIPRHSMICHEYAMNNKKLGPVVKEDAIFETMPNLILSMLVIEEKSKKSDSSWDCFLDAYPKEFATILYYDLPELLMLKPSYLFESAVKVWRSICRQYSYFYLNMINPSTKYSVLSCSKVFTFDLFRWAISVVMSRQNLIPSKQDPDLKVDTLIPLWDFMNHEEGKMSTDFDNNTNELICYAMRDFKAGEEVKINYGQRSNFSLLLYAGFVYENNTNDFMFIKLGVSKNDKLYLKKKNLLDLLNIPTSGAFKLKYKNEIMDSQLISFLRVFHLNSDELDDFLKQSKEELECFQDVNSKKFESIETKIIDYLSNRAKLLIRSYQVKNEEQLKLTSIKAKNISLFLSIEKKILESFV